jgi:hypothetical protein
MTLRFLANNDTSLLELKDSDYVNKYKEETEDKDIKGLAMDVNKDLGEDEFNKEES